MRYDICAAVTHGLNSYKLTTKEGELLRAILPIELERKVDKIDPNTVEFSLTEDDQVEAIANSIASMDNSDYKNIINFSTSILKPVGQVKDASSEEITGYRNGTEEFFYSCLEIINNGTNTLLVGGTVIYKQDSKESNEIIAAALGKWIYDSEFIANYSPLQEFYSSKHYNPYIYKELCDIEEFAKNEEFVKPENYVRIVAGPNLALNTIQIANDGELLEENEYSETYQKIFDNLEKTNPNPRVVLKALHQLSNIIYLSDFDSELYGKFNTLDFIKGFIGPKTKNQNGKAKQLQKNNKAIMVPDPKK